MHRMAVRRRTIKNKSSRCSRPWMAHSSSSPRLALLHASGVCGSRATTRRTLSVNKTLLQAASDLCLFKASEYVDQSSPQRDAQDALDDLTHSRLNHHLILQLVEAGVQVQADYSQLQPAARQSAAMLPQPFASLSEEAAHSHRMGPASRRGDQCCQTEVQSGNHHRSGLSGTGIVLVVGLSSCATGHRTLADDPDD